MTESRMRLIVTEAELTGEEPQCVCPSSSRASWLSSLVVGSEPG